MDFNPTTHEKTHPHEKIILIIDKQNLDKIISSCMCSGDPHVRKTKEEVH